MSYDVRAIANYILDCAEAKGNSLTNFEVNKITYFLYVHYLVSFRKSLVSAKIEAWQHGPVFRELYHEFKKYGREPISEKATVVNIDTGEREICEYDIPESELAFITGFIDYYMCMPAPLLYDLSHEKGGPWWQVWNHEGMVNPGMAITDELIIEYFSEKSVM